MLALADDAPPPWRDRAATIAPAAQALRTPAWLLVQPQDGHHELFAKPDDRWEANEVANRCREAVEQLSTAWIELQQAAQNPQTAQLSPLSELLLRGID
jgi:hypothetical protein